MRLTIVLFLLGSFLLTSCKSDFEKVRTSSDPKLIYKTALDLFEEEDYQRAQTLFELAIPFYRGKSEAEELFYKYASTFYEMGDYILASHYYGNFSKTFYNSDKKENAAYLSAFAHYQLSPSFRLDQTYSDKSIEGFQEFINQFPNSEKIPECNKLIDEIRAKKEKKAFYNAELYFNMKRYKSAIQAFENLLKEYPNSQNDEKVRFLLIESNFLLAKNSIFEKKEKRYKATQKHFLTFEKKYPKSKLIKKARKMNKTSIKELKNLDNLATN